MFSKKDRRVSTSASSGRPAVIDHAGINNLGNSCYLNSIVQGLAASRPLRDALAGYPGAEMALKAAKEGGADGQEAAGSDSNSNVPLGTPTAETSPTLQLLTRENAHPEDLPLSSALASTLVKLWSGKQSTISVKSLMKALNRKSEDWNEFDQMDAHELLRFLLDGVSMEEFDLIKKIQPPTPAKPKSQKKARKGPKPVAEQLRRKAAGHESSGSDDESGSSDDLSTSEAESLLAEDPTYRMPAQPPAPKRFTPFIDTIFGGKLASVIVCEECRGVNRIEEDFLDISLPLKSDDGKVRRRDRLRKFLSSSSSNLSQEQKEANSRPKLAPRAPTAILSVSETEASEPEEAATRAYRLSSNASGASAASSVETGEDVDEKRAKVKRRKSLDPGLLRASSTKRNFLNPMSAASSGKTRDSSSLSRGNSVRTTPATSGAETTGSDVSGLAGASRKSRTSSSKLLSKPTREQQDYIRKLFAEIPGPSPLAGLRIAQPGAPGISAPTAAEANGSAAALTDAASTGLYTCLMQFTSVEALEGDNAFQCRRCWKLLNPGLAAQVGRKRASKLSDKAARTQEHDIRAATLSKLKRSGVVDSSEDGTPIGRKDASSDYMQQQHATPRASVSAGSKDENMVQVNRRLIAEKDRQRLQEGDLGGSSVSGVARAHIAPDIRVTANSPPISPAETPTQGMTSIPQVSKSSAAAESDDTEAGVSGFSQLTVTASNGSKSSDGNLSDSSPSVIEDSISDAGAEADAEGDQSESEGHQAFATRSSANTSAVSFADQGRSSGIPMAVEPSKPLALPPRAQRYISRKAHKRYLISALPAILVLHLKRFQQTSKSSMFGAFNNLKKLDDKVSFPLYLDMAPFMAPPPIQPSGAHDMDTTRPPDRGEKQQEVRGRPADTDEHRKEKHHWFRRASPSAEARSNCQYRLYAVIVHQGNMGSGHYVAYVLTSPRHVEGKTVTGGEQESQEITKADNEAPRQWLYCSDDLVKPASVDEVLRSQAYCLLYERIQPRQNLKL